MTIEQQSDADKLLEASQEREMDLRRQVAVLAAEIEILKDQGKESDRMNQVYAQNDDLRRERAAMEKVAIGYQKGGIRYKKCMTSVIKALKALGKIARDMEAEDVQCEVVGLILERDALKEKASKLEKELDGFRTLNETPLDTATQP